MPIEIKELHISFAVFCLNKTAGQTTPVVDAQGVGGADREALVAECVEQVLQILRNKSER
ncbi:MAG TPA: DUF5908 family protein [Candidatus Ozemobacteraceae bacterium]|nr:DUF5908 family protein [Candidatus Ozemobacteraceae bacterium]